MQATPAYAVLRHSAEIYAPKHFSTTVWGKKPEESLETRMVCDTKGVDRAIKISILTERPWCRLLIVSRRLKCADSNGTRDGQDIRRLSEVDDWASQHMSSKLF
jgi:hypothetical protein